MSTNISIKKKDNENENSWNFPHPCDKGSLYFLLGTWHQVWLCRAFDSMFLFIDNLGGNIQVLGSINAERIDINIVQNRRRFSDLHYTPRRLSLCRNGATVRMQSKSPG